MRINRTFRSVSVSSMMIADPIMAAAKTIAIMILAYVAFFEVIGPLLIINDGHLSLPLLPTVWANNQLSHKVTDIDAAGLSGVKNSTTDG